MSVYLPVAFDVQPSGAFRGSSADCKSCLSIVRPTIYYRQLNGRPYTCRHYAPASLLAWLWHRFICHRFTYLLTKIVIPASMGICHVCLSVGHKQ